MARPQRRRRKIGKYGAQPRAKRTVEMTAKGLKSRHQPVNAAASEASQKNNESSAKAKAKQTLDPSTGEARKLVLTREDKRYLLAFFVISIAVTALYWYIGGRNLFVFPAVS